MLSRFRKQGKLLGDGERDAPYVCRDQQPVSESELQPTPLQSQLATQLQEATDEQRAAE